MSEINDVLKDALGIGTYNIPERIVESGRKVEENILSSADKTETLVLTGFRKLNRSLSIRLLATAC